jgi:hypothetical protein
MKFVEGKREAARGKACGDGVQIGAEHAWIVHIEVTSSPFSPVNKGLTRVSLRRIYSSSPRPDRLEIFGFEDLLAIEAFHIVHTVAAGDDYRFIVLAGCLHTKRPEIRIILTRWRQVSRGLGVIHDRNTSKMPF